MQNKKYTFKPYSEMFPLLFEEERKRISSVLDVDSAIEHVGSTSVSGLGGKGIIDIAIGVSKGDMERACETLQKLGYEYRSNFSTPERFYLVAYLPDAQEGSRRYHIHLTDSSGKEWRNLVGFRDYLKQHPEAVAEYAAIKKKAADMANQDGEIYRKIKEPIFLKILFVLGVFLSVQAFAAEESFLFIDGQTNAVIMELGSDMQERISPCSTFKIPLSLMGYDAKILQDAVDPTWDFYEQYDDWLPSWKQPQSPLSWMQNSCVWYSKVLSRELGLEKIQRYVVSMAYGNRDVSGGVETPFWINSSIEISVREQVDFMRRMLGFRLPVSLEAVEKTKAILFKEEVFEGWKLFGKTGWSGSDIAKDGQHPEHGWFVGWIEKEDRFCPFAYLIRDRKIALDQRVPRVRQLLLQSLTSHP